MIENNPTLNKKITETTIEWRYFSPKMAKIATVSRKSHITSLRPLKQCRSENNELI